MKLHRIKWFIVFSWLIIQFGCIEPYNPPEISTIPNYLVVDGYMEAETGNSEVRLTHIQKITDQLGEHASNRISGAHVSVMINSSAFDLPETGVGVYSTTGLDIQYNDICKLIIENQGKRYESEEILLKETPEIDSISYDADQDGVGLFVTTHDPTNSTLYYRWQYEETSEYTSTFFSYYYYDGSQVNLRDDFIYQCWKTSNSTNILIGTSSGLNEDVIYKFPLLFLEADSWKKERKYSLLVKQYAMDKEAYKYWKELENYTENVGSLFDPQPSQLLSNIKNIDDPSEQVLGYFSPRSVKEKRIFISSDDLPRYPPAPGRCTMYDLDSLYLEELNEFTYPVPLVNAIVTPSGAILGYTRAPNRCMDCRVIHDGTTVEPDFWE